MSRRRAAVPPIFNQLVSAVSKADLAEALWGLASLVGEDVEDEAVLVAIREVNVWRALRGGRPLSPKPFAVLAGRGVSPTAKEALLRLAALVKSVASKSNDSEETDP